MDATFGIVHPVLIESEVVNEESSEAVERLQQELQQIAQQLDRLEVELTRFVHKASHGFFERQH